ncbi:AAA family ATPase [Candidatus Contubernalis alkaliaceticus]|uniref:AAA family ATPase n=1 Tax=Candidatus Contubernalis alkaliaceticus TaxID=338645 RepID=UPI001F4BFFC6|nr:AAA family ATPase [Candidatus Contubernalis alkalaceticus]UNC91866.1 AAA family ATPase [Candidatus Contubernalis alkalaceticus]
MIKELSIGFAAAAAIIMIQQGFNVVPWFFMAGLILVLYYMVGFKGLNKSFSAVDGSKGSIEKINFDRIGGHDSAKKELLEALEFVKNSKLIMKMGIRPLKGILLMGPPGTGKTLLAKAAAGYTDSVFLSASGSEFIEVYAGVGAQRVRQIFNQAKEMTKKQNKNSAIIFIDEIEILGGKRGSHGGHLEYDQTLNQLLVEMDGISCNDQTKILVIAATNRSELLDSALVRPGRFDRMVNVDLPDLEGREQILKLHTRNKPMSKDVNLKAVAQDTFGFSGAHLESLTNEAAILAMRDKKKFISQRYFLEAVDKVMMGEKMDRKPDIDELWRIAVHETGHALMSETIRPGSVSSITTTSRGKALGYMRQTPDRDFHLYTKEYLEGQINILLAGSLAEEEILGSRSTGASADFQQAIGIAKELISSGMSTLGVVSLSDIPGTILHDVISSILEKEESKVKEVISCSSNLIKEVADYLLNQEKISGEAFRKMLFSCGEKLKISS